LLSDGGEVMSTILDALKKSEQERKLNEIPTLQDMPAPQEQSRWPLTLAIVLAFLLLALLIWVIVGIKSQVTEVSGAVNNNEAIIDTATVIASTKSDNINVNVISFAEEVSARFAIINGKLFREGEFVMAGVKVETIEQDAVVLNERGKSVTRTP